MLAATGLAANRLRTAALATPIVRVATLAGIQGTVESSNQRHTEDVTRLRVHAPQAAARRQRRRRRTAMTTTERRDELATIRLLAARPPTPRGW